VQTVVEAARGEHQLIERLRRGLRTGQHGEQRQASVVLRVHGVHVEGAGPRQARGAQDRAPLLVGLVEDRELAEHETLGGQCLAQRTPGETLRTHRHQAQRHDAPVGIGWPLDHRERTGGQLRQCLAGQHWPLRRRSDGRDDS
jgi:hypothetical protein